MSLITAPTPLEDGGRLPSGAHLWIKRDDLNGLGAGGNKGRKLEYLCGEALARNADCLVTVGAAQSNHCRMTAAAGARLGLDVHLVLSGPAPRRLEGNQLLSAMFGAHLHHTGVEAHDWAELERARAEITDRLAGEGCIPHSIPIGGSTAVGALGYVDAHDELMAQCAMAGFDPSTIIHTSSSGGTHAGLIAGRARARHEGRATAPIVAVGVAKGVALDAGSVATLARATLSMLGSAAEVTDHDVVIDDRFLGTDYAAPTIAAARAAEWAAHRGAWILDPVYTAKGFAGVLGRDAEGLFGPDDHVVFIHTGGLPSVFARDDH